MKKILQSLFAFFDNNGSCRNVSTPRSRVLRCEALEDRALLSATAFDASSALSCAVLDLESTLFVEDVEVADETPEDAPIVIPECVLSDADSDCDNLFAEALSLEITEISETLLETDGDSYDAFFEEYGVYINGQRYISLSDLQNRPSNANVGVINPILPDYFGGGCGTLSGGTGGGNGYDIVVSATYHRANVSPSNTYPVYDSSLTNIAVSEGQYPNDEYPLLCTLLDGDYMKVSLPGLPYGYKSQVTFGGTATFCQDYAVYVKYDVDYNIVNGASFDHSGGSTDVYIFPLEDRFPESDETSILLFGTPTLIGSGGGDYGSYTFNELVTTATMAITDNDDWKVKLDRAAPGSGPIIVQESGSPNEVSFILKREDAGNHRSGDEHYPIAVVVSVSGTATTSDYLICQDNSDGTQSTLTVTNNQFSVVIPAGAETATFIVKGVADGLVERFYETLVMSVVSATYSGTAYGVDSTSLTVKIKDCDAIQLDTVQFLDNIDIVSDTDGQVDSLTEFDRPWGDEIHWERINTSQRLPVGYSCFDTMNCRVNISGYVDSGVDVYVRYNWKYTDINGALQTETSPWTIISEGQAEIELDNTFEELFEHQYAYYDLFSVLEWDFAVDEQTEEASRGFGENINPLYITYDDPISVGIPIYHTIIHTGCVAANKVIGEENEGAVFDEIWGAFESKNIQKVKLVDGVVVNDGVISYYGKAPSEGTTQNDLTMAQNEIPYDLSYGSNGSGDVSQTRVNYVVRRNTLGTTSNNSPMKDMLLSKDGLCSDWASFAENVYCAQGIPVERNQTYWNTTEISGQVEFSSYFSNNTDVSMGALAFKVKTGVTGQGGEAPFEHTWLGHEVIKYGTVIYDPSYGLCYGASNLSIEEDFVSNLQSFGVIRSVRANESCDCSKAYEQILVIDNDDITNLSLCIRFGLPQFPTFS